MERHFEQQLELIAAAIQRMGGLVEQAIGQSVEALVKRENNIAAQVIRGDEAIDQLELEIDQLVMETLARYQLAARDLRFVTTAMKIAPDLERIADYATSIAERAIELNSEPPVKQLVEIPLLARGAQEMVRGALDAFVNREAAAARAVIAMDDDLDRRLEQIFRVMVSYMIEDPRTITRAIRLTFVAKHFERIGDQATNICEMVVYMAEGRVIKHHRAESDPPGAEESAP
jgi:phosphate transport system protein